MLAKNHARPKGLERKLAVLGPAEDPVPSNPRTGGRGYPLGSLLMSVSVAPLASA
jgi:hypothetical protein